MKHEPGDRQCDNAAPHQAHRYDRATATWGCLGVAHEPARSICPVHLYREPCQTCAAYMAAGL